MTDGPTSPAARRAQLMDAMAAMGARGVHCGTCVGTCCTFVANSMRVTPEEALDLVAFLRAAGADEAAVAASMRESVARFGLDRPTPGTGSRDLSRRRYTCPFYDGGHLGCRIDQAHKPYGCLAFNPRRPGVQDGEDCGGDDELLEARRNRAGERADFPRFGWDKLPIPLAVLAVLAKRP